MHPDYFDCVDVRERFRAARKARWRTAAAAAAEMGVSWHALAKTETSPESPLVRSVMVHAARLGLSPADVAVIIDDDETAASRPPRTRAPREPATVCKRVAWCATMTGFVSGETQALHPYPTTHLLRSIRLIAAELAVTPSFLLDLDYAAEPRWFKAWAESGEVAPENPRARTVGPARWFKCADCGSQLTMPHSPRACARMAAVNAKVSAMDADAVTRRRSADGWAPGVW